MNEADLKEAAIKVEAYSKEQNDRGAKVIPLQQERVAHEYGF